MKSRKRNEPDYGVLRHELAILKRATEAQQRRIIEEMTPASMLVFDAHFETWAHANQLPPNGDGWRVWLMMAGRGFGKTRAGAEWIYRLANGRAGMKIALIGATIADARSIMIEGVSGLLSVRPGHPCSRGRAVFRHRAQARRKAQSTRPTSRLAAAAARARRLAIVPRQP